MKHLHPFIEQHPAFAYFGTTLNLDLNLIKAVGLASFEEPLPPIVKMSWTRETIQFTLAAQDDDQTLLQEAVIIQTPKMKKTLKRILAQAQRKNNTEESLLKSCPFTILSSEDKVRAKRTDFNYCQALYQNELAKARLFIALVRLEIQVLKELKGAWISDLLTHRQRVYQEAKTKLTVKFHQAKNSHENFVQEQSGAV